MQMETIRRLLHYLRPYRLYLAASLLCAVVSIALTLFAPVLVGYAVDLIIGPGNVDFDGIWPILLQIAAVSLGAALFQRLMTLCTNQLSYRTVHDLRRDLFGKLNRVPLKYIDSHPHGDLMNRVATDIDQVSDGLLQGFSQLFTGVVTIVGTLIFMLSINVWIALLVVVLTPLSLFVASFIAKRSYNMFRVQSSIRGELGGLTNELIGGQKVVKAFAFEQRAQTQFDEINGRLYTAGVKAQFYSSLTNPCTRFVNGLVYATVCVAGALLVLRSGGTFSVGSLSCFLTYANQYTKPFNEISGVVTELQNALACAQRVFQVLDEADEPSDADNAVLAHCDGHVVLDDVSFSYHPARPLLQHLRLDAQPGQRIAIVGPTGCGKTTLINLLMRFYDVTDGAIRVSGQDVRSLTRSSLRGSFGMVLQDTWLFSGSIRDNIAYGNPDATQAEVEAAARAAHAHNFILQMPQGYETRIEESGGNLSVGQKQLLCIARIMLTHPAMLILDEATSSIDTRTELQIQEAFLHMMQGRTSFIVAHRLSTIQTADVILVMRDGSVVEQGTHESLLQQGGFYATLYNSQFDQTQSADA